MISGEIGARSGYKGREPCNKVLGTERDVRGAVAEGALELILDLSGGIGREVVETKRRPGDRATQPLHSITLVCLTGDGTVQGEAVLIGGERLGRRVGASEYRVLHCERSAADPLSDRYPVADRGSIERVQRVSGFQIEPGLFRVLDQRKYSNHPYADHLAEVAAIVAAVTTDPASIAVAWLHHCMEDQRIEENLIRLDFGERVAYRVTMLSDLETGNRATRKAASRTRLANAEPRVQSIKVADLICNTSSVVIHDPRFARIYLKEKRLLFDRLDGAGARLRAVALVQSSASL